MPCTPGTTMILILPSKTLFPKHLKSAKKALESLPGDELRTENCSSEGML